MKEFISGLILPEVEREEDYVFLGGQLDRVKILPGGDWRPYLPNPEAQATRRYDPYSCVSMSFNNVIETHLTRMMEDDPEIALILKHLNALDANGRPNFSDRWLAKMSGTIPGRGSTQDAVFDAVRKYGLVGESVWPKGENMDEVGYYADIDQPTQDKGLDFLKFFGFGYEKLPYATPWVKYATQPVIDEALEYSPLWCCCDGRYEYDENGLIGYEGKAITYNHAIEQVSSPQFVWDSYPEFLKQFVKDYKMGFPRSFNVTKKKSKTMKYRIKGNNAIFLLDPVSKKLVPFGSGQVYKVINGTVDYDDTITVDSLEELLKLAPLADWIITTSPWDSTSFTNSLTQ